MQKPTLVRLGAFAALVSVAACADAPVAPDAATPAPLASAAGPELAVAGTTTFVSDPASDESVAVSPFLAELDAELEAAGSKLRVTRAELLVDGNSWDGSSTVIIANNRSRGLSSEWVAGDPRRDGRVGVTWAFGSSHPGRPVTRNPDGSNLRLVSFAELDTQLEEGLAAWRNLSCSSAPITRVAIPMGTDPDYLDDYFRVRHPSPNYAQPADIVESGWQPSSFFTAIAGPSGNSIIGVTFTFHFVDDVTGQPTDIDNNGKWDEALAEIFYNTRFAWGNSQANNVVDFFSIITHETGHAMGLAHFGKVFVTQQDAADGISIADIKYAPKAMMNAVYVTGRSEIAGTDNSSFCQIWASRK
ncbi:MAG TPA: hypothetical protein VG432_06155 [Gemmatimonadaceae bacterium]|nr:hypothetical protein [Gemmatimonadaceae bacterium]